MRHRREASARPRGTGLAGACLAACALCALGALLAGAAAASAAPAAGTASGAAGAEVRVDPELTAALAAKDGSGFVSVLYLLPNRLDLQDLNARLVGTPPAARRAIAVEELQQHAEASQRDLRRLLEDAVREGRAADVRFLWIVNGIAFAGDAETVRRICGGKAGGELLLDKPYDMIGRAHPVPILRPADSSSPEGREPVGVRRTAAPADTAWSVKWIGAPRVWDELGVRGAGVVVGHLDTGVWLAQPDLVNRLWTNQGEIAGNGLDDDGNGYVDDVHGYDFGNQDSNPNDDVAGEGAGHGTHTAGTVAGDGTGGTLTGVAPGARIMVCKVALTDGSGAPFSAIYEAQQYGLSMGAQVFTMSMGVSGSVPLTLMQAERYNGDAIRVAGVVFFNAAGNENGSGILPPDQLGVSARVPAPWHATGTPWDACGGVITVGGTGYKNNQSYSISSRGPATWGDVAPWRDWPLPAGLTKPDVCAPAVNVNSLQKPSGYTGDTWSGTSMACPHAAGVAALMLEQNPSLSPAGVDSILEQTAVPLGTAGKDNVFGSGRIDAFAAVSAVPYVEHPYVVATGVRVLDSGGDGFIDPGEAFNLLFKLANNSRTTDALGLTGELTAAANPYVAVRDGSASFPDLAARGATGDNGSDLLSLIAAADAPQGFEFRVELTVTASSGYRIAQDFTLFVGLPDHRDHDVGDLRLTVTHQGILGYLDDSQMVGSGCGPAGGGSYLFLGSFWGGTGADYICNRDYSGTGAGVTVETYEWVSTTDPNGRVADITAADGADQAFQAVFSDAGHASPRQVRVTQRSYAWAAADSRDFVVLEYTIHNGGEAALADYYAGVFCDWDVGDDAGANVGGSDSARHLAYINAAGGPYTGVAALSPRAHRNLSMINNQAYVYPEGSIMDDIKARLLKGSLSLSSTAVPGDYSMVVSVGPMTIEAGADTTVAFAMVMGSTLDEIQDAADQALYKYTGSDGHEIPQPVLALAQNMPNPFNPSTTIQFSVTRLGPVVIEVLDLQGRHVRTLVDHDVAAGEQAVIWDGTSDAGQVQASGLYFYRFRAEGRTLTRKMMLIR